MTLADSPNKVRLSGDGITTSFPFSFPLIQIDYSDLYVYKIDIDPLTLNETNTLLVSSTDYTITPVTDLNNRITGGSIEITSFIPSVDQDIFAIREQDFEQELELKNNQNFPEKAVEKTLDKLMAIEQQQAEEIDRSVKVNKFYTGAADFTLPFPVGGEVVGYSADGLSMTTYALTDIPTIAASTLGATFVQLTTEEAMRDLLLLGTADNVEFKSLVVETESAGDDSTKAATTAFVADAIKTDSAFRATLSGSQVIATATATKIQFDTETWDLAGEYDNATNYRFTPLKAGKYKFDAGISWQATAGGAERTISIYKNGALYQKASFQRISGIASTSAISGEVSMNGSTDYIEVFGLQDSGGNLSASDGWFNSYYAHE